MVKYLEELLHEKTKDSQSSILFAQWSYDKKIIPTALQAVANLFPHYSLHDESHSVTIINNIVRILGKENLTKLSSIDIWLILEAAYWHDLGMVVSGEKLVETMSSKEFIQFMTELINDKKNSLHDFAVKFEVVDGKIKVKNTVYNLELNDSIKFILAEFFRRKHAERSSEIVSNPIAELPIVSPRGVIPERIIRILGDICSSHTKDFSQVMSLSFNEVGIDIENAHPRFVACLLRIGDLLDLDNNRFSEVMLRTLTKVPIDTLNHKAKHLAITSFRVDREKIEITANCEDYDIANITQHWLNYLNSEISSQMINWNDIVPDKSFGYLPTIGALKVNLLNYDLIDGKNKPKFSVDTDKALDLLRGAGIYDGAYQSIREVLQNSVDSSLIRVWLEHKGKADFSSPLSASFKAIVLNYPIVVTIEKLGIENGYTSWKIDIEDKGIGISKNDLKFLMNTGSSSKNYAKINIVNEMPVWMKPSGTFGIGFQSIFMITDQVVISTKSYFDENRQVIELNSPSSKKDGDVLIKKESTSHFDKPGAKISIVHKTKAIPSRYSVKFDHRHASSIAENFDPFVHESLDIEIGKIIDEVISFSDKAYLPVQLIVEGDRLDDIKEVNSFEFYDSSTNTEISVFNNNARRYHSLISYYKGQVFENGINDLLFLRFEINIHKDNAYDVLTLNRNKIKDEYYPILKKDLLSSSFKLITTIYNDIEDNNSKIDASMYLHFYANDKMKKKYDLSKYDDWRNYKVEVDGEVMLYGDLFDSIKVLKIVTGMNKDPEKEFFALSDHELTIHIVGDSYANSLYTHFFVNQVSKAFQEINTSITEDGRRMLVLYRDHANRELMNLDGVKRVIRRREIYGSRTTVPCPSDFFELRLKEKSHIPYLGHYRIDHNALQLATYPEMVFPYVLERKGKYKYQYVKSINEKLYNWIYENRFDKSTSKEQIINAYDRFCSQIDIDEINRQIRKTDGEE
ncbi:HD domain-containing protein [Hymenobacter cellulosilyticus]|uniref:ATP-binding protein n=1 Tax=Hymenobacter cellulosilyticus TaxID=2932248 RepID=A0A8T9QJY7_9BACT|nr:ATP-binding protein [Hymenobacter cellulosilyticus]UOQ75093.1 ATP-binding protein [Hymenobacter cellulosilyticus]